MLVTEVGWPRYKRVPGRRCVFVIARRHLFRRLRNSYYVICEPLPQSFGQFVFAQKHRVILNNPNYPFSIYYRMITLLSRQCGSGFFSMIINFCIMVHLYSRTRWIPRPEVVHSGNTLLNYVLLKWLDN